MTVLPEQRGLLDIRRFRRARWGLIFGTPILSVIFVIGLCLQDAIGVALRAVVNGVLLASVTTGMLALLGYPACPRCGQNFEAKKWGRQRTNISVDFFTRCCQSCGLRLDPDANERGRSGRNRIEV
jgi:hypothetical protein